MSAFRLSCLALLLGFGMVTAAAPAPKSDSKEKTGPTIESIRKALDAKATYALNEKSDLATAARMLSDEFKVNFTLDRAVIQQMGFEPSDVPVEVNFKDVKLRNGLRTMLNPLNLTFVIIGDGVLITTEEQAIYRQMKQRINVDVDSVPLNKALKDLAQSHGINVVIDPRTFKNKAAEALVTLAVDDVPIEAVVRLMCEMAALKPTRMGNVIFVTTEDRADKLKDADSLAPNPGLPSAPMFPGGPGGLLPGIGIAPAVQPEEEKKE